MLQVIVHCVTLKITCRTAQKLQYINYRGYYYKRKIPLISEERTFSLEYQSFFYDQRARKQV